MLRHLFKHLYELFFGILSSPKLGKEAGIVAACVCISRVQFKNCPEFAFRLLQFPEFKKEVSIVAVGTDMPRFNFKSLPVAAFCFKFLPKLGKDYSLVAEGIDMYGVKFQGFIEFLNSGFLSPDKISKNSRKEISLNLLFPFSQESTGFHKHIFFPEHPF